MASITKTVLRIIDQHYNSFIWLFMEKLAFYRKTIKCDTFFHILGFLLFVTTRMTLTWCMKATTNYVQWEQYTVTIHGLSDTHISLLRAHSRYCYKILTMWHIHSKLLNLVTVEPLVLYSACQAELHSSVQQNIIQARKVVLCNTVLAMHSVIIVQRQFQQK
jgi:hypothetical protein